MKTKKAHILAVDDSRMIRTAYKKYFKDSIHEISFASSGEECLELLNSQHDFDLIILDITLPGKNGLEILSEIRVKYDLTTLPVIMLTSKDDITIIETAFSTGANDYINKPFHQSELLHRVDIQLKMKELVLESAKAEKLEMANAIVATYNHELNNPLMIAMNSLNKITILDEDERSQKKKETLQDALERMRVIIIKIRETTDNKLTHYVGDSKMLDVNS